MTAELEKYRLFLDLVDAGIAGRPAQVPGGMSPSEWEFLYDTSSRQAVQGLVYDALEQAPESNIPEDLAARWLMEIGEIEKNYARIEETVEMQAAAFRKHGIHFSLLKGLESAKYYPRPEHRIMGDIDWWMHSGDDWDAALELAKANGASPEYDSDGDVHYTVNGIVVEHHRKGLRTAGPCGELLLLNEHALHHALVTGVGMRQIADYKAALRYFDGKYDREEYEGLVEEEGLKPWTEVLETLPDRFLELVMEDGNFGLDKKNRFSGFFKRASFFARIAPGEFVKRWWGLVVGRIKRK